MGSQHPLDGSATDTDPFGDGPQAVARRPEPHDACPLLAIGDGRAAELLPALAREL